jgi:hypothetical protein
VSTLSKFPRRPDVHTICAHRRQSQVFVVSEELRVRAVLPGRKEVHLHPYPEPVDIGEWPLIDNFIDCNFAAALAIGAKGIYPADVDVDYHLHGGAVWLPDDEQRAGLFARVALEAVEIILGYELRHKYGRASQGGHGHAFIRIAGDKAALEALRRRKSVKAVPLGKGAFRVELRLGPQQKTSVEFFTLPGSTYASRVDPSAADAIHWQVVDHSLQPGMTFEKSEPIPAVVMGNALYAATLAVIAVDGWEPGSRHDAALRLTGVLARDVADGLYEADHAERLLRLVCRAAADDETEARVKLLATTLAHMRDGRVHKVFGFQAFADCFGQACYDPLVKLRNQGDPHQFEKLQSKIVYTQIAEGERDVFLNLDSAQHGTVVQSKNAIREWFSAQREYQPVPSGKKLIPLIDAVLASKRYQTVAEARQFPGVPFRTLMRRDDNFNYRPATEEEELSETCVLNIGTGYATPLVDDDELVQADVDDWERLWVRHLMPVCGDKPELVERLTAIIAHRVQRPLEKLALGICLTGGGGIGKSSLFNQILPQILGMPLFGAISVHAIEGGDGFPLEQLPGRLFLISEENGLNKLKRHTVEILKDLMKNPHIMVNRKGVQKYTAMNYALPVFVTNNANPSLNIDGMGERSLRTIKGIRAEDLGVTDSSPAWYAYQAQCSHDLGEFLAQLRKRPGLRQAGMAYLARYDLGPDPRQTVEAQFAGGQDVVDGRDRLSLEQECIVQMAERNAIFTVMPELFPISASFKLEWWETAILAYINKHGAQASSRRDLKPVTIGRWLNRMFRDPANPQDEPLLTAQANIPADVQRQDLMHGSKTPRPRVRYFKYRIGTLINHLEANLGIKLEPEFDLNPSTDYGLAPIPKNQEILDKVKQQSPLDKW